jgi:hypothetical protein
MKKDQIIKKIDEMTQFCIVNNVKLTEENFFNNLDCFCNYGVTEEILENQLKEVASA